MGEHLPCKQGVKSSNLSISMQIMKRVSEPDLQEQPMHTCVHKDADVRRKMDNRRISMNEQAQLANAQIRNSGLKRTLKRER